MNIEIPDYIKKYFPKRSGGLSVFGSTYRADWNVIVVFFLVCLVILFVLAGVGYYWMETSVFPEDLEVAPADTTTYTHDKAAIEQAEGYMQQKERQFDAAR